MSAPKLEQMTEEEYLSFQEKSCKNHSWVSKTDYDFDFLDHEKLERIILWEECDICGATTNKKVYEVTA